MCDKCEKLRKTKVGSKTSVEIGNHVYMVIDRYEDSSDVFIHTTDKDGHDGSWLNYPFDIKYCPFCGEKIIPYGEENDQV